MNLASWILATRPKTLTAAFIPVSVAASLAYRMAGVSNLEIPIYALLVAIFIQIGTNLVNDALDFKKGADTSERLGPTRATQSGLLSMERVLAGGMMCFGAAILFSIPLIIAGGWPVTLLMGLSVLCGYAYTGGPFPLAYLGLGDLFVLLFFGFAATCTVFYLQTGMVATAVWIAGAQVGLLSTVMIAVNNLRDVNQDTKANKKTLPVRFGKTFARIEISLLILLTFLFNVYWFSQGYLLAAALPWLVLPIGTLIIRSVWSYDPGAIYNRFLGLSALLHILFGTLLSIGFLLG